MSEARSMEQLTSDVEDAQAHLTTIAKEDPDKWWWPDELRSRARNGHPGDVMMFALTDLVNREVFEVDKRLRVKFAKK